MNITKYLEDNKEIFACINDCVWDYAELKFDEVKSKEAYVKETSKLGFSVEDIDGIPTAFIATYGSGKPEIGILAEYDALTGLSQKADIAKRELKEGMETGHGCGHNTLGAGAFAAATTVKKYLEGTRSTGTVKLFGCPGEEGGSGKAFMAKAGVFNSLDCAITWHPGTTNTIVNVSLLANVQIKYKFKGISSHAAASPHLGRSALDAVELMNVGCNYLREHIIPEARVHYAITNTGGMSPNVVQPEAEVLYLIRAPKTSGVNDIYERVNNIAKGAALMTGTEVKVVFEKGCSNIIPNDVLGKVMYAAAKTIEPPVYTDEEKAYAQSFVDTLSEVERKSSLSMLSMIGNKKQAAMMKNIIESNSIFPILLPYFYRDTPFPGSSDVGDVSWITPTIQCSTACHAFGTPAHSWQQVAQGKSSIAHKGMLYAAEIMAKTAIHLFENQDVIEQANKEMDEYLAGEKYQCPIPDGIEPQKY